MELIYVSNTYCELKMIYYTKKTIPTLFLLPIAFFVQGETINGN